MPSTRSRSAPSGPRLDKRALFADVGYEPHEGQWRVHRSAAPRRVLAAGARAGKTKAAAHEALAAALQPAPRSLGWLIGPTYDIADRVFREVVVVVAERLRHRLVSLRENAKTLVVRNLGGGESTIQAKSADNPVSLLGAGLDFVVIDEAAQLHPRIWESFVSQRLIDKRGWALMISTPKGRNWFEALYRRGQSTDDPDYESWQWPSWVNPLLDREFIEAERARLPERVFAEQYEGKFIEGSGSVFRNVRECATGELAEPVPGKRYYAGLDLARYSDFTVLCVLDDQRRVVHLDRFTGVDWSFQTNRVVATCERYNRPEVLVDSTGVGEPIYEGLRRAGVRARPYAFTQKSKAALIDNLSLMLERREIVLPRPELCPELVDELESFAYSVSDAGNVRTGAPGGGHDDTVIALALACWQIRPHRPRGRISFV